MATMMMEQVRNAKGVIYLVLLVQMESVVHPAKAPDTSIFMINSATVIMGNMKIQSQSLANHATQLVWHVNQQQRAVNVMQAYPVYSAAVNAFAKWGTSKTKLKLVNLVDQHALNAHRMIYALNVLLIKTES
jgi:hypothetical protein